MSISVFLYILGCQFTRKKRNQAVYFMSNRLRVKYRGIKCWNTSFKQIIYTLFKIYILLLRIFFSSDKNLFNVLENCFRKFRKRQLYFKSMTDIFKKVFVYEQLFQYKLIIFSLRFIMLLFFICMSMMNFHYRLSILKPHLTIFAFLNEKLFVKPQK